MATALEVPKKPNGSEALQPQSMIEALQVAIVRGDLAIDVLERFVALRDKELARQAELDFNDAMNAAQSEIKLVVPDRETTNKRWKWASHVALDEQIRPIYLKHGFSLSFDEGEFIGPDVIQVVCYVSHKSGHTRKYHKNIPCDGKGAAGGDVMSKADAAGAADTRGIRYLIKKIFNIPIGEDEAPGADSSAIAEIIKCDNTPALEAAFRKHFKAAEGNTRAQEEIIAAKDRRKRELRSIASTQGVPMEF